VSLSASGCRIVSAAASTTVATAEASSASAPSEISSKLYTDNSRFGHSRNLTRALSLERTLSFAVRITVIRRARMMKCFHCLSSWSSKSNTEDWDYVKRAD
jgi:hypothetical protein